MREDPIITGAWIKAALLLLVAGALGVGAYVLASGVDVKLPDLPNLKTNGGATTSLSDTTLESTTMGAGHTPTPPSAQQVQKLNDCIQAAGTDLNKVAACLRQLK